MNFKAKAIRFTAAAGLALVMTLGGDIAGLDLVPAVAQIRHDIHHGARLEGGHLLITSARAGAQANTNSSTVAQAPKGATVTVEEDAGNGWYKVTYGNKTGYMSGEWLTISLEDGTGSTQRAGGLIVGTHQGDVLGGDIAGLDLVPAVPPASITTAATLCPPTPCSPAT